jgi:hypothetical protein
LYTKAARAKSKIDLFKLFDWHYQLVLGDNNLCQFEVTKKFAEIFGQTEYFNGKEALKRVNFEAVAGNVILKENNINNPCFIDYEWVFDFPVPAVLVKFHLIDRLYFFLEGLAGFIPRKEFLAYANIDDTDADHCLAVYEQLFAYYADDNLNLGLISARYEKPDVSVSEMISNYESSLSWHRDYVQKQQEHIEYQNGIIERMQKEKRMMENSLSWKITKPLRYLRGLSTRKRRIND